MEICRREISSGEDVPLLLVFEHGLTPHGVRQLSELLELWPMARYTAEKRSELYKPRVELGMIEDRVVHLVARWFPEEWFEPFARDLERSVPSLRRCEIGFDFEPLFRSDGTFVSVPHKAFRLEDGAAVEVNSFEIAKYPVTIAEFSRFAEESGYATIAEQRGAEYSFRHFPGQEIIPAGKELALAASYVSYVDATAYCSWAGVRLPTEAEWVSAAILDDTIYETRSEVAERYQELSQRADALVGTDYEITATILDGDRVVVRCGPTLARHKEWNWNRHNRVLVSLKYYKSLQFRVCK